MATDPVELARLAESLEALRKEVARLGERVAALESVRSTEPGIPRQSASTAPLADGISEELLLVISAAIAAYLGKTVPIRQIRLLGSAAWSQQGRVTIQASHQEVLSRHGR
jgi:methylmalonyl-CoA carboxyltransferase large subunit